MKNKLPEIEFSYQTECYTLYIINEDGEYYVTKNGEDITTDLPDDANTDEIAENAMIDWIANA